MSVGEAVRKLRETLGLTQAEFARRIGVTTRALQRYEADARQPEPGALVGIIQTAQTAGLSSGLFSWLLYTNLGLDKRNVSVLVSHPDYAPAGTIIDQSPGEITVLVPDSGERGKATLIASKCGRPARYIESFARALDALESDDPAERERARRALDGLAKATETEARPDNG
jgi:transcriptional regulator with XRE-family HTH domain